MKKLGIVVAGASIFSGQASAESGQAMLVGDLASQGIYPESVISLFQASTGASLSVADTIKVSYENEGENIRFDALDGLSVTVALGEARGSDNKVDGD